MNCRKSQLYDEICDCLEKSGLLPPEKVRLRNSTPKGLSPYNNLDWASQHYLSFLGLEVTVADQNRAVSLPE